MNNKPHVNPTDDEVKALAEEIYESTRTEFMPPFNECPYSYIRGYLNDAAERLGLVSNES